MRSKNSWAFILVLLNLPALPALAQTISIPIPGKNIIVQKPAADLVDPKTGQVLDVGAAASMAEKTIDLSTYEPVANKMWQPQSLPVSNASDLHYPKASPGVKFLNVEASTQYTVLVRVQSNEDSSQFFRLGLSRLTQSMMMRSALLRKLGYDIPSPKEYPNLRVQFDTEAQKADFLEEAQKNVGDFDSRHWVVQNNLKDHSLVLASSSLEVVTPDAFDLQWGLAPNPDFPDQLPLVQQFSKNRAYRALILPYSLVDVPESVNRFSAQYGLVTSGNVIITYPMATSFAACTYADARWILRKLQSLSIADFQAIVSEGGYPKEIEPLLVAKLVHRSQDALRLFGMPLPKTWPNLSLDVSSISGLVKNGKVTQEFVTGYPQRFSHGDRSSPYEEGDFGRYLKVEGITSVIGSVLDRLNEKMQAQSVSDLAAAAQQNSLNSFISKLQSGSPLYQEVSSWGGFIGGLSANASRHIATGTYYGSNAAVQLVDDISVSAGLGYFRALDGLKYFPAAGANVSISRNYTHVRPILTIKEGSKVSWKSLIVPAFMRDISKVLATDMTKKSDGTEQHSLDAFLQDLREGEVFTVTDSVALGAYLQVSASMDVLLGMTPFNFLNSVTLGADANRVILRQTQFVKTAQGVQVFVRQMKNRGAGVEMNVNYFLNILKIRSQLTLGDVDTDAFVIDYNPDLIADIDDKTAPKAKEMLKTRDDLRLALLPLIRKNETEILYSKFANKEFHLQHEFKTIETKAHFLALRFGAFSEEHKLDLDFPKSDAHPELKPADERITLYGYKRGELIGRDFLGMFFDVVDGILNFKSIKGSISRQLSDNPANVPFGKAEWRVIDSEADLSKNVKQQPSVAIVQHVWGGWKSTRAQFLKTVDGIESEFRQSGLVSYPVINRDAFQTMTSLDFYRITENLSVLNGGVAKIRDLITQPDANNKPEPIERNPFARLFQKLSEIGGKKARANDKEMFDDLLMILGNGNLQQGTLIYDQACQNDQSAATASSSEGSGGGGGAQTSAWWYGTNYSCLAPWMENLLKLSRKYPATDKAAQAKWLVDVLKILDDKIPLPQLLKYLGESNYVFVIRVNGFRTGDEDGDLEYFSSSVGDPNENIDYANGLFELYARKTRILPTEVDRTIGGFQ